MSDEEARHDPVREAILWGLLRQLAEDPNLGARVLGLLIYHRTIGQGRRDARISYAEINDHTGMTPRKARPVIEYMARKAYIERNRLGGRPGEKRSDPRGDYYRLHFEDDALPLPEEEGTATRAGPTKERLEGVTSSLEPQGALGSPDKEHQGKTTDQP